MVKKNVVLIIETMSVLPRDSTGAILKRLPSASAIRREQKREKKFEESILNPKPPAPSLSFIKPVKSVAVDKDYNEAMKLNFVRNQFKGERTKQAGMRQPVKADLAIMKMIKGFYGNDTKPTKEEAERVFKESRLDKDYFKTHNLPRELATMVAEMYREALIPLPRELKEFANVVSITASNTRKAQYDNEIGNLSFKTMLSDGLDENELRRHMKELQALRRQIVGEKGLTAEDKDELFNLLDDEEGKTMDMIREALDTAAHIAMAEAINAPSAARGETEAPYDPPSGAKSAKKKLDFAPGSGATKLSDFAGFVSPRGAELEAAEAGVAGSGSAVGAPASAHRLAAAAPASSGRARDAAKELRELKDKILDFAKSTPGRKDLVQTVPTLVGTIKRGKAAFAPDKVERLTKAQAEEVIRKAGI